MVRMVNWNIAVVPSNGSTHSSAANSLAPPESASAQAQLQAQAGGSKGDPAEGARL